MSQSFGINMLIILVTLASLFSPHKTVPIKSLLDLPLTLQQGNWLIHATLTDQNNGDKYFVQEFISAQSLTIKGKIVTSSEQESFDIHYAFPSTDDFPDTNGPDSKRRLVVYGSQCSSLEYKNSWDSSLPGVSKPLTNLILLMGPSILFRIDHEALLWQDSPEKDVRGTMMKSANTTINRKLNITYYYKRNLDIQTGIQQPSRIEFIGNDPGQIGSSVKENLIFDIYLQKQDFQDDFNNLVQPLPGVGCPYYFEENLPLPKLKADFIHMIMNEVNEGLVTSKSTSRIYASSKLKVMRLTASLLGMETEAIYDYSLGVIFMIEKYGGCSVFPMESTSPGLNALRQFDLNSLFLLDGGSYQYLGRINFGHRSGFPVKVWESVRYDAYVQDQNYDKAVITQYFAESADSSSFDGHILASTTVTGYKFDSSSQNYILTQRVSHDYMDVQSSGTDAVAHDIFTLSECNDKTSIDDSNKLNLKFKLGCSDTDCIKFAERNVYKLKEEFENTILTTYYLSPLRIDDMQISFTDNAIYITTTFLETPTLTNIFNPKTMLISDATFDQLSNISSQAQRTSAGSESECLEKFTSTWNDVIVYCPELSICASFTRLKYIIEDVKTGHASSVYNIPLHNLRRLREEVSLQDLQTSLIQQSAYKTIYLKGDGEYNWLQYNVVDIIEEASDKDNEYRQLFSFYMDRVNIVPDELTNMNVPNVNTFSDCYRACVDSDDLNCHTFAFCQNGAGTIDCRLSTLPVYQLTVEDAKASSCSIYKRNSILDYSVVKNKKFKNPGSVPMSKSLAECAELCSASNDCTSFEYCGYKCTFGGFYADSIATYSSDCQIYTPKLIDAYEVTGHKLTTDLLHTEMNLNLEQCAALCFNWANDDNACNSFNFCPKSRSESSCSLSKYSVKSSDVKTTDGGECYNYELKNEYSSSSNNKQSTSGQNQSPASQTNGTAAFGIVTLFLFTGFLLGVATPFGYKKINQIRRSENSDQRFVWSRQLDEQTDDI